ncbi:Uncharacterised protein [Vibrio cholerae]|nr:Uncharacterised protein [Vibrio cholerae]
MMTKMNTVKVANRQYTAVMARLNVMNTAY